MVSRRADAGFTLLEVLVALAVFGMLMAGLAQAVRFGFALWRTQTRISMARGDLDAVDRTLRELIARANPAGLGGASPFFKGTARALTFATDLPDGAGALAARHVDVTLAVDRAHRLLLTWRPHAENRIGPPRPPLSAPLLTDVDHLELSYWQRGTGPNAGWRSGWAEETLPHLVRIRIVRTAGARPAPDIVCAPMRDRWRP